MSRTRRIPAAPSGLSMVLPEAKRLIEFCVGHKKDSMVNVKLKRCTCDGCGIKMTEFCSQHMKEGTVDVDSRSCSYASCTEVGVVWCCRALFLR